ncbi:MAG: alpha/beta fold hydrolase [Lentisphaerae bacterium]|nr:alpha/beta fold hydrolase [Lentisphaerota bacterium]
MCKISIVKSLLVFLVLAALPQLCRGALSQPKDIAFKAAIDGTEQYYMEMLPTDFDQNKKYDLIIGLHGHGSDRTQFATVKWGEMDAFREFASKYNMIAITPDYRAKTSWMGPKAEADVVQIIKDLKNKYKINKVFIVGASMGGTSVLTFAALHPDMVDGVTSMNGHANHLEYLNFQDAISESFGGSKDKIPLEYKKRSAEYWPELLTMPIAFTTGGKDMSVPPDSSLRLAEILKKLNRKVLVIHRPDGGHGTTFADSMAAMEFMYDPLKPAAVAASPASAAPVAPATSATVASSASQAGDWASAQPSINDAAGKAELGLKFSVQEAGKIKALRFYQGKGESGAHALRLWDAAGKLVLTVNAPEKQEMGWIFAALPEALAVKPGDSFTVSYNCSTNYPATPNVFKTPIVRGGITGIAGVYSFTDLGEKAPEQKFNDMNYFVDVEVE